jgi:hypothetical protein
VPLKICQSSARPYRHFFVGSDLLRIFKVPLLDDGHLGDSLHSVVGAAVLQSSLDGHRLAPTIMVQVYFGDFRGSNLRFCVSFRRLSGVLFCSSISNRVANVKTAAFGYRGRKRIAQINSFGHSCRVGPTRY